MRPFVLLALCVVLPVAGALLLTPRPTEPAHEQPSVGADAGEAEVETHVDPAAPSAIDHFFIGQGGTLAAACERLALESDELKAVLATADRHLDLRRLSPRTGVSILRDSDGTPRSLAIRSEPERFLRITLPREGQSMRAELLPLAVETRVEATGGSIESSVAQALGHVAHAHLLTQAYADIFQWDVDLLVDPRPGDEVRLVYEVQTLGAVPADLPRFGDSARARGEFVGLGRVLAATYEGSVAKANAFWVEDGPGWGNYFDGAGRPLRKSFLRSPLNYRRISSGYSSARRHPVTRKVVPHHGVDFAAAPGTPITATADGRVISAGWDGALGQAVRLRHGGEYVTIYGHMKGFANGIRAGVEVRQGDVIGYVGSSGRATGPHLHYSVLSHGRPINPMKMKNPTVAQLDERLQPWLQASQRRWMPVLAGIHTETALATTREQPTADTVLSGS